MSESKSRMLAGRFFADYGMIFVLILLAGYYSYATYRRQYPVGAEAGEQVAARAAVVLGPRARVLIVTQQGPDANDFVRAADKGLREAGLEVAGAVIAGPAGLREELEKLPARSLDGLVVTRQAIQWKIIQSLGEHFPNLTRTKGLAPTSYYWPDFLKKANLLAIADRIVVIAVIAIGMTMVIITGGIDLSVGSLIALSAVVSTVLIRDFGGAERAGAAAMIACCAVGMLACAASGLFSGVMVTLFSIPPFIVTLGMMLVASGLAFMLAGGESIYRVPAAIDWLGRGTSLWGIPNTVAMMVLLYAAAHVLMTSTVVGRYIYAVGGNVEAARLSGVPVRRVILLVYAVSGLLAGLGGVVQASQLQTGAPTYGVMYELYVIAAVVVGGTSLSGGQGRILGTLIGAFVIAVIQNGMTLDGVGPHTQKVVLGLVILLAVLLDMLKKRKWRPRWLRARSAKA